MLQSEVARDLTNKNRAVVVVFPLDILSRLNFDEAIIEPFFAKGAFRHICLTLVAHGHFDVGQSGGLTWGDNSVEVLRSRHVDVFVDLLVKVVSDVL